MDEKPNFSYQIPKDSIVLKPTQDSDRLIREYFPIITNSKYWHAFVIHNSRNQKRNKILKIILDYVYPETLLPIHFEKRGNGCIFLARNCTGAIVKLLKNKLVVPDPSDTNWTYTLEIFLRYSLITQLTLPTNEDVSHTLKHLYDNTSKTLNLEKFAENKELRDYTPLSQPKLLCFVLHVSRVLNPSCIMLNGNEIRTLSSFKVLKGLDSVRKLDLRNNLIEDMRELKNLKIFKLEELWLDDNPLCSKYNALSYVNTIRNIFPMLQKLDGVELRKNCRNSKKFKQMKRQNKIMTEEAMSRLTGINILWTKRLLQDARYDIIEFLTSFVSLLKKNKIPEVAFSETYQNSLLEWLVPKMVDFGIDKFEFSLQKKALKYIKGHPSFLNNLDSPPDTSKCKKVKIPRKGEDRCRDIRRTDRETHQCLPESKTFKTRLSENRMKHCWRCGYPRPRRRETQTSFNYHRRRMRESQTCLCPIKSSLKRRLAVRPSLDAEHVENSVPPKLSADREVATTNEILGEPDEQLIIAEDPYSPADVPLSPIDDLCSSAKDPYTPLLSPTRTCHKIKHRNLPDVVSEAYLSGISSPISEALILTCESPLSIYSEISVQSSLSLPSQSSVLSLSAKATGAISIPSPSLSISTPETSPPTTPLSLVLSPTSPEACIIIDSMGENQDIFNGIPKNSVVLSAVNISENLFQEHSSVIENRNNWHAFLIHNVKRTERNAILKVVLDHVYPEALLPISFQTRGTDCIFLARNCSGAIGILLKTKLVIPDPSDTTWIYTCEIILKYSTISKLPLPANNIAKILELLYDKKSKILDLTNFSDNKDLSEYSPLSQPKLLCFALHLSDELKPTHIKLNNNDIRTLSPFVVLKGKSSLQKLDLSNNSIEYLEELNYLNNNLVELWLDGNPVCAKYDAFTYTKIVKKTLPMLEKLDGVSIGAHEFPISQQYFFCNNEGFDLVDQFVSHFYSLYDNNRKLLIDLYHRRAIFSMTTGNSKRSGANERLQVYSEFSRNIMSLMSSSNSVPIGSKKIVNVLRQLPKTKHHIPGFSVDLIFYRESSAVISITGTFVEDPKQNIQPDFVFNFKRTFTIIKRPSDYVIYNDVLHVDIASEQVGNREVEVTTHKFRECEKRMAQEAMSRVTGVDKVWVKRLLEDANYNINKFLKSFMSLLKKNKIPELAYSQNSEHSLMEWLVPKMEEYGLEKFEDSLQKEAREYIRKTRHSQISSIPSICNQKRECSKVPKNASAEVTRTPFNTDYYNHTSEKECQIIPKNTYKNNLIEIQKTDFFEFETKHEIKNIENKVDITSTSGTSKCGALDDADKNPINNPQGHKRKGSVMESEANKRKKGDIKIDEEKKDANSSDTKSKKNENKLDEDGCEINITPTYALLNAEWINVQEHDEYDFHLAFNKWILVQKDKEGKFSSKQDDFQKSFTCWKKHFPTYPNEILNHSLHSSCLNQKLKSALNTIKHPVTYWDFPATVPYDIRPPKRAILQGGNVKKLISQDSGYRFVSIRNKWVLVTKNTLDLWVTPNNERKVTWKGNGWVLEQLTTKEKDLMEKTEQVNTGKEMIATKETSTHPSKNENTNSATNTEIHEIERKKMTGRNIQDTLFVCEDEDIENPSEDPDVEKKLQLEELKTIYSEDTAREKTITDSDLHLLRTGDKENTPQPKTKREATKAEMTNKWKKLFEFVPYIPKLALMEGYWTFVCHKSDLKFHKTHSNDWILMEKNSETNEWCEVNDDFCLDKDAPTQEEKLKNLGKYIFDHIPMPVTLYDFPSSVPMEVRPPKTLLINKKNLEVTPDSDYAYVSVKGQWVAVKRDAKFQWTAVDAKHEAVVKKKLANMPSKSTSDEATVVEVDKKISSVTCTLLQLVTGVKLNKPLTHWDVEGPEEKRPPKLALTEINGELRWCYVSTSCRKGFVLEDGVWVKVVPSEPGHWKATEFSAYPGCIIGYYLFDNIWVTMKKYVLGGKWSPISDSKTSPTTYWNHVGPEETKPPKKIRFGGTEKIIHNNSDMGFVMKEGAWVLVAREGNIWKTVKENDHFLIYKLINGIWRIIDKDTEDKWFYKPLQQKIFTYKNFDGLKKYAPPRQISLYSGGVKIKRIIDEKSGLGFVLNKGVWVLKQSKDGKLIPVKDSKGKTNFGYKLVDGKLKLIRKDEKGEWIEPNITKNEMKQNESTSLDRQFSNAVPLTYDRILIDVPERLKPPKHALLKDIKKGNLTWHVIDEHSGFGFTRDNDTWSLMKWIYNKNWVDTFDEVEYRYKIIDNSWYPVKKENNVWVPIFDPKTTPKIPELCVESPEKDLPNKILMNLAHIKSKINVTPSSTMGFLEMSDKYVLVKKMSSGKLFLFECAKNAVVFKQNINGAWVFSTPAVASFETDSNKIDDVDEIKTYANTEGTDLTKPPQYVKIMEGGNLKWKEIDSNSGYGFVRRKYWTLVKRTGDNWRIVNKSEGYDIIDNRWVLMQNINNQWLPAFDPHLTPRCSLDSVGDSIFPIRVITYKNGEAKYINTANDCSLAFTVCAPSICMLMKQEGTEWINMQDDLEEAPTMAFKLIDCKWRRMKKDTKKDQWLPCSKQFDLPVLHIDVIGDKTRQPPSNIRIVSVENKSKEYNMSFNIFSEEGFVQEDGCWVLQKPTKNGWIKHPGIFGVCGFRVVNNELSVFDKIDGEWVVYGESKKNTPMEIPIERPVTYKEIADWPEREKPPMDMLVLQHSKHALLPNECTCNYGFVKHKHVWVVVKKNKDTWEVHKKGDELFAYKLIENRWLSMKIVRGHHWGLNSNQSSNFPQTYLDTYGTFEQKPPLRIVISDDKWKLIYNNDKLGFIKKDDMWVLMLKVSNHWKEWMLRGNQIGYKILDGQWTKFTKSQASNKWIIDKHDLLVLSCDFIPGDKNAPPSSLNFGVSEKCSKFKHVSLEPGSIRGFLKDNGAWVLMQKYKDDVTKFKRFTSFDTYGYMLKDGVWKIVVKDIDGSWKSGSFDKQGRWCYDIKLSIPFTKPIDKYEIDKLPQHERPPQTFVMFEYSIPKKVSLASIENTYGFANNKGVWVLLTVDDQCKWKPAGGIVAYKLIRNRWVSMTFQSSFQKWVQSYDPIYTPITHFESTEPSDSRPPLRIALNESGNERWKVIFQHSGFGFCKKDDLWVLMEKRCDGTWRKHEDYVSEFTGYKMVNSKWTRFKRSEGGQWICKESSLPSLQCDFSEQHDRLPPPSFNNLFLKDPRNTRENTSLTLASYAKFGFRKEDDVWVLMECDKSGVWKQHKMFLVQTDLFGYKYVGDRWKLMKKMPNGKWVEGKLEYSSAGAVVFVKEEELMNPPKGSKMNEKKEIKNNKTTTTGKNEEREVSVKEEFTQSDKVKTSVQNIGEKEIKGAISLTRERTPEDSNEEIGNVAKKRKLNGNKENQSEARLQNELTKDRSVQDVEEVQRENVEIGCVGREQVLVIDSENQENKDKTEIEPREIEQPCEDSRVKDIKDDKENNKDAENEKEVDGGNEKDEKTKEGPIDEENEQQDAGQEISTETKRKSNDDQQSCEITTKKEIEDVNEQQGGEKSQESTTENEEKHVKVENKQDCEKTANDKIENDNNDQQRAQNKDRGIATKIETIEKENTDKNQNNNSYKIPITNPVQYHELTKMPVEDRPPKSVCLNIRGAPRRIPLVSKMSKIGFQHHNGVWVLLERLSGVWRILHNSSGLPLAYKLIDNRWVSMRTDKNGCWIPTFNPATTPRTYFDTEGPDDAKPPRRIAIEENGRIGWKEIGEFCGFGFLKNDDVWVLMKKITSNNWATYKNNEQESFGFKVQDTRWTKFKKRPEGSWEMVVDDLPLLHYDFTSKTDATPPEFTSYLQKRTGKDLINVGFRKVEGAWVFMELNQSEAWVEVSGKFGFVRATGELWNVVEKDENGRWIAVKSNLEFESAFDHVFPVRVKRERESLDFTPKKKVKIEPVSPATSEHIDVKQESIEHSSSVKDDKSTKTYPTETSVETSSRQDLQVKTIEETDSDISSKTDINKHQTSITNLTPLLKEKEVQPENSSSTTEVNSSIPNSSSCHEDKVPTTAEHSKIDTPPMGEDAEEKKMDESNSAASKSSKEEQNLRTNTKPDDEQNEDPKSMQIKEESTPAIPKDEKSNKTDEPSNVSPSVNREDLETTQNKEETNSGNPTDADEKPNETKKQPSNVSPSVNREDQETTQNKEELIAGNPTDADEEPNETNNQPSNVSPSVNREDQETTQNKEELNSANGTNKPPSSGSPTANRGDLETTQNKEELNSTITKDAQEKPIDQPSNGSQLVNHNLGTTRNTEELNSAIPKETEEKPIERNLENAGTTQNKEKLNCVEMYLALKPDCCLGCPELQSLLRKFRPATVPNKILRKKFRLPDGSYRMLSIPRALPVGQASSAIQDLKKS
ncbi:uncharacterized protein LOC123307578 [Coccinella septempunctata]|uniref:uncharacterized protein LOC123307578 n=1 Tax=Coccinella septempunctata TaxID=41139 RepID=UPI001D098753|nr:uncharacterized protein LOC123307578 [Coccinella septempunctata]